MYLLCGSRQIVQSLPLLHHIYMRIKIFSLLSSVYVKVWYKLVGSMERKIFLSCKIHENKIRFFGYAGGMHYAKFTEYIKFHI